MKTPALKRVMASLALCLASFFVLYGCGAQRQPDRVYYRPGQQRPPAQYQRPPQHYIPPAPPPAVITQPPAVTPPPTPVGPPIAVPYPPAISLPQPLPVVTPPSTGGNVGLGWVDLVSRKVEGNIRVRVEADKVSPHAAARVYWETSDPVEPDYYFAGFDQYGIMVVVDYNNPGETSGSVDGFKKDLERVAVWKINQNAGF